MNQFGARVKIFSVLSLIYMALIFYLSSYPLEMRLFPFHFRDKLIHAVMYGVLASLVYLTLEGMNVPGRYVLTLAFTISFLYGVSNEIYQHFIPWRRAEILDVVANGVGAFCFLMVFRLKTLYQNS